MRMIMLIFSLKLVGHKYLHPIFVSICGLLQAITVVFKSMKGKKKFYKLTTEDLKQNSLNDAATGANVDRSPYKNSTTMILT